MAGDFARVNRRMHNKSLTADNQITIVGGRNIGDEYFEAGHEINPSTVLDSAPGQAQAAEDDDAHGGGRAHAALHGKVLVFDCREFFVGSMNLDPRSAFTNTEIGFVVDAPDLAGGLCKGIDGMLARAAYRLELQPVKGSRPRIEFVGVEDEQEMRYDFDPHSTGWQRFKSFVLSLLPIKPFMTRHSPGQPRRWRDVDSRPQPHE